jgi:hypothetical protein
MQKALRAYLLPAKWCPEVVLTMRLPDLERPQCSSCTLTQCAWRLDTDVNTINIVIKGAWLLGVRAARSQPLPHIGTITDAYQPIARQRRV